MTPNPSEPDRIAPGALALVQEFLNTPLAEPTADDLRMAEAIRRDAARGEPQPTLAARYGVSQQLVSAILRRKRLSPGATPAGDTSVFSLGTPASSRAWLAANGFPANGDRLAPSNHADLLELHRLLLAIALANNGEPLAPGVLEALDGLAARYPLVVTFRAAAALELAPGRDGAAAFIATILAAVYDAMRFGEWPRLKACPAERCQHVFYDTSRNRTSTWCSMAICGNRTKVRNYQRRRRVAGTA